MKIIQTNYIIIKIFFYIVLRCKEDIFLPVDFECPPSQASPDKLTHG